MDDFLKFFAEKVKTYPMHLEITYSNMEALVKSAEFVPETKEDKRNAETDSQRRRLV